jgi:nitrate/TMAO reductase-like tetraheme cytochrome c subunit
MEKEAITARALQFATNAREQGKAAIDCHVSVARVKDFVKKNNNHKNYFL